MSSHQLEFINVSPHIGIILNLFEDHLDHAGSVKHYHECKMHMFDYQNSDDIAIYSKDKDLLSVAVREVEEETGLQVKVLSDEIFAINANSVQPHIKRGKFISTHAHLDVVYLMEADDTLQLVFRPDESKGVKWISFDEVGSDEIVSFMRLNNKKLVKKLKCII